MPNTLTLFLPDYTELSVDNIVELRYIAHDELVEMRSYIMDVGKQFIINGAQQGCIDDYLIQKIKPAIKNFDNKVKSSHISTIQKALKELKNPMSYVPFITSIFTDIPRQYGLLASLGIMAIDTCLDVAKSRLSLKDDPLYFTVDLKKRMSDLLF